MNITQNLLTPNSYSRPRIGLNKVKAVVIHWVANPGSSAEGNRNFFESRKSGTNGYGSAHYIVKENTVIQCIPNNEMAYHVGSNVYTQSALRNLSSYPNNCTIGIEMCHNDMTGKPTDATYKTTLELACSLLKKYGLTHENLWTHHQVVGWKDCHRYYTNNPSEWVRFVQDASKILTGKSVTIPTPTPANNRDLEAPDVKTRESYIKNTVIADSLNVRTQRNANSSIVLTLPKGSTVQYQKGSTQNGWGYIKYTNSKGATYSGYVNVSYIKSDAELGKGGSKPKTTPSKSTGVTKKQVVLPASASSWRIYPLGKAPVKANALSTQLNPKKFGGLTYDILDNPQTDVYTIKTDQFGKVNIYAAASTGAKIVGTSSPKSKSTSKPNSSGVKSAGKIKIVGVKSAAIVMDRPDKNKAKNLGTVELGDTVSISGSVKGLNNAKGYWEVIFKGKRGYISGQFGSKI
ncbi:N-acetylmuramoyl-L-alanine amidase [Bacillus velezensis]|uniref:N-acetylmuramoyl-L-alanine amidase n=1 Tax=Bacillus velezensis TaxID=492670 RepID=UPI00324397F5